MEGLEIALDATLAASCAGLALYCTTLSHRLRQLRSARSGVAPALEQLTKAVTESRTAALTVTQAAEAAAARLDAAHRDLTAQRQATEDLSAVLDGQAGRAERRAEAMLRTTERTMAVLAQRAHLELEALSDAVEIAQATVGAARREAARPVPGFIGPTRPDPAPSEATQATASAGTETETEAGAAPSRPSAVVAMPGSVRQRAAAGGNPFLRRAS